MRLLQSEKHLTLKLSNFYLLQDRSEKDQGIVGGEVKQWSPAMAVEGLVKFHASLALAIFLCYLSKQQPEGCRHVCLFAVL